MIETDTNSEEQTNPSIGKTTMDLLQQGSETLGINLSSEQMEQFYQFYHELVEWNQKFNLTAITEFNEVQIKHFLDSIVSLPIIAEELGTDLPIQEVRHAVDVGTGAGMPGIPLKIVWPKLKVTLMDGTGKKIQFMNQAVSQLGLTGVDVVQGRAEELGRQTQYRGQFDLVMARAVAPLNTLVEYLLPLARRNGHVIIYKGANVAEEFMTARNAIETLGGETVRLAPVQVPFLDQKRFILLIKKIKPTPERFPRGQGLARKDPL